MDNAKKTPVARCTRCGATNTDSIYINMRCQRTLAGKRCSGTLENAIDPSNWELCTQCKGSGIDESTKCASCRGDGWIYCRNT